MLFSYEEKRRAPRSKINKSVRLKVVGLEEVAGSLSQDISLTGLKVVVSSFMAVNTELILHVELGIDKYVDCVGRVMWVREIPYADRYELGIKFESFEAGVEAENKIKYYLMQRY